MRQVLAAFVFCLGCFLTSYAMSADPAAPQAAVPPALDFQMQSLDGKPVDLKDYQGKVLLVVNVASKCGATPQYRALQDTYDTFKKDGLVVLGFPCNQFGRQEPGSAEEIQSFCTKNYGVTFPLFAKIDVNGAQAAPLYQLLTSKEKNPHTAGPIKWNFEKFLIGRDGRVVQRFGTRTEPDDPQVVAAIQAELAKK